MVGLVLFGCGSGNEMDAKRVKAGRPGKDEYQPPVSQLVDIDNECPSPVRVFFGEKPGGEHDEIHTLRPKGLSHIPRDKSEGLTVWIVDDRGFGLAHVTATKFNHAVEIGESCKTLSTR